MEKYTQHAVFMRLQSLKTPALDVFIQITFLHMNCLFISTNQYLSNYHTSAILHIK